MVTSAALAATPEYSVEGNGFIHSITYLKDTDAGFGNNPTFLITNETTGETLWTEANVNASETIYPRPFAMKNTGAVLLFAAGEEVPSGFVLANERIKFVITSGGTSKKGTFIVHLTDAGRV